MLFLKYLNVINDKYKTKTIFKKSMLKKDIIHYQVEIDPEYSEGGEDLGIDLISNVKSPAVKIKGMAFSNQEHKKLTFADSKKYRIAAPALVPDDIYRNDEDGEYFLRFTPEIIEKLAKKFMSQLNKRNGGVFNLEHGNEMVDSYILEAILADDDAKVQMIKDSYGVEVPKGTFFIVQQFNDKQKFEQLVANSQTGFSIEGFLGMTLIEEPKQNKLKFKIQKMKRKQKFVGTKRVFRSASKRKLEEVIENDEIIVVVEEVIEGSEVVVIEDVTAGPIEDFSGEVDVVVDGVAETLIIEEGVITEIVVEDAAVDNPTEMEEEKEETLEIEGKEEEMEETNEKEVVDYTAKFEEVYEMIAEIKAQLEEMNPIEEEKEGEKVFKKNFSDALIRFNQKFGE
jgi:hypothetical protein